MTEEYLHDEIKTLRAENEKLLRLVQELRPWREEHEIMMQVLSAVAVEDPSGQRLTFTVSVREATEGNDFAGVLKLAIQRAKARKLTGGQWASL